MVSVGGSKIQYQVTVAGIGGGWVDRAQLRYAVRHPLDAAARRRNERLQDGIGGAHIRDFARIERPGRGNPPRLPPFTLTLLVALFTVEALHDGRIGRQALQEKGP